MKGSRLGNSRQSSPEKTDAGDWKKKYEQMEAFYKRELEDQKARADHTLKTRVVNYLSSNEQILSEYLKI